MAEETTTTATVEETTTDKPLAAEGEKALEAWKQRAKDAEKKAREADSLRAELDKVRDGQKTETERLLEQARKEAADEARADERSKWTARTLQAEVRAAAGGKLADPADAVRLVDLDEFTVGDDGTVDGKSIAKAIDRLVESKPYLAAQQQAKPNPSADGGAQPNAPRDPGVGKDRLVAAFAEQQT